MAHLRGAGGDADQTAADYDVPRAAVAAALAYYRQHQAVIDARITLNAASRDAAARPTSGAWRAMAALYADHKSRSTWRGVARARSRYRDRA
ncbi:MAG: hypothetical protein IT340_00400 [Chloroflexi bacterium]|nr:hypothetical protein [Chloroflexota bacterium]